MDGCNSLVSGGDNNFIYNIHNNSTKTRKEKQTNNNETRIPD